MAKVTAKSLMAMEKDGEWLQDNYGKIKRKYGDQFVAVDNEDIIANGKKAEEVIKKVEAKGEDPAQVLIEFISKKDIELIL